MWPHFLSMSSRALVLATCGGHGAWQSPGEVCQLTRICTACGCFPGSPFCQAPSWIPEVFSTTACRTMELREEHHLLSSYVSLCSSLWFLLVETFVSEWHRNESRQSDLLILYPRILKNVENLKIFRNYHSFLGSFFQHMFIVWQACSSYENH
jgi:hypothetical protein